MGDARALAGTTALVTGGGSGIGLACARHLLRDGAIVTIAGRNEDKLRAAADTLAAEGGTVRWIACDVTAEEAVRAAVEHAAAPTGNLDVAVANAGAGGGGPIFSTTVDAWRYVERFLGPDAIAGMTPRR